MILDLGDRNVWERAFYIREYFYNLQGSDTFSDSSTPQARALSFILRTESNLNTDDWRLKQRYILAVLYYSTDGPNWPNRPNGAMWDMNSVNECSRTGITCGGGHHVTQIELSK